MDGPGFDRLTKALTLPGSRRRALSGLLAGGFGLLGTGAEESFAHDLKAKCKKKSGKAKKKCLKKARKHAAQHANNGPLCGNVTCPAGQTCCPDQRCGATCCANGRACNVVCSGPNGNDYCCHPDRPAAICGGCWQRGSVQCDDPKHCCGPLSPKCCGNDHCCAPGYECLVGCPGNTCCKGGQSPTCCPDGTPG